MQRVSSLVAGQRRLLHHWCGGPSLVICVIQPVNAEEPPPHSRLDNFGAGLHLEWEAILEPKSKTIHDRMERCQELAGPTKFTWRSGPGTFCVRTSTKVFLVGGSGDWYVDLYHAPDFNAEQRSIFELQRFVDTRANPPQTWLPPGHTHIECLAGFFAVGGVTVPPRSPISINKAMLLGWEAQGAIRSWLEV